MLFVGVLLALLVESVGIKTFQFSGRRAEPPRKKVLEYVMCNDGLPVCLMETIETRCFSQLEKSFGDTFEMIAFKLEQLFVEFYIDVKYLTTHLLD